MAEQALHDALASSQRLGMLGDRSISEVLDHSRAFVAALAEVTGTVVDLGSGGGVPGLVVAHDRPDLCVVLVDRRTGRTDHLRRLVRRLDLGTRVVVRSEDAFALVLPGPPGTVVARGFASPGRTAEAAARLLAPGGLLVVSEPPEPVDRWLGAPGFTRQPWADRRVAVLRRST